MSETRTFRRSLRASAPRIVHPLRVHDEDGMRILECNVDGYPKPDIRWEKSGKPVGKSRKVHIVRSGEKCLLQIRQPREEDCGHYTCTASNIVGTVSTHVRITTSSQILIKRPNGASVSSLRSVTAAGLRSRSMDRSKESVDFRITLKGTNNRRPRSISRSRQEAPNNIAKSMFSNIIGSNWKRNGDQNLTNCRIIHSSKKESCKIMDMPKERISDKHNKTAGDTTFSNTPRTSQDAFNSKSPISKFSSISISTRKRKDDQNSKVQNVKESSKSTDNSKDSLINKTNINVSCGVRSRSASRTRRNCTSDNITESKFPNLSNSSWQNNYKHNSNKQIGISQCKKDLSKSVEDCRSNRRSLFNKVKIPEIFTSQNRNSVPCNSNDSLNKQGISTSFKDAERDRIGNNTRKMNGIATIHGSLKGRNLNNTQMAEEESKEQKRPRSRISKYLQRFEGAEVCAKRKDDKSSFRSSLKQTVNENSTDCNVPEPVETGNFFSRLIRRKSNGSVKKSTEVPDCSTFISHLACDAMSNQENLNEVGLRDSDKVNKISCDIVDANEVKMDMNLDHCDDIATRSLYHETAKTVEDIPNIQGWTPIRYVDHSGNHVVGEVLPNDHVDIPETLESERENGDEVIIVEKLEQDTQTELEAESSETNFQSEEFIFSLKKKPQIPSICIHEIPETEEYDTSEETADEFLEKSTTQAPSEVENNLEADSLSTQEHCKGRIRYSSAVIDEECQDLLELNTQTESVEAGLQRVTSPVESPARILTGPQSVTVLRGESITLAISFCGSPVPNVIWMKGGQVLQSSEADTSRLSILSGRDMSVVSVSEVTADDSGKYVVCVENDGGGDSRFASVAVVGFPEPPGGEPTANEVTDHSLVLSWYGSMYDGGSVVTGYQVEMCTLPDKKWHKVTSSVNTSCSVQGLSIGQRYVFRVRAENKYGVSHPSKESKIICLNDFLQYDTSSEDEPDDESVNPVTIENGNIFTERFDLKEEVGKGRFGTVYRCVELSCGRPRAAKVIRCLKMKDKEKVRQEIEIMSKLHHPKLMQVLAAFESGRNMIMIMEFISGGELFERVIADDFELTEQDCILFMKQICDGVAYMHRSSILHLDLKPENILCKTRTSHKIKIIDFGLARMYKSNENLRILFGTPEFVAPEIINYEPVSPASDMWSVGVICYVLLSGLSPFMGDNDTETFANITRGETDFDDEAFDQVSQDAKDFISLLLVKNTRGRMKAEECLKHPWLATARLVQKRPLSTEKLKRFIIRRKWQKSGTAIRALGRMVSLSRSSLGSSLDSYSPLGSPTSSRSRSSLVSRSETTESGDSDVFLR